MPPVDGPFAADVALAELRVFQDKSEHFLALLQDLVPVSDEEQPLIPFSSESLVVECRNPGLAGSGGGDHEVAEVSSLTLRGNSFEHLHLERLRLEMQT